MNKKVMNTLFILGGAMLLIFGAWHGTPDEFSKEAWPKTEAKAKQATIEPFKKEKYIDVVITRGGFSGEYATHEIYLDGYIASNGQQKISAVVDSFNN